MLLSYFLPFSFLELQHETESKIKTIEHILEESEIKGIRPALSYGNNDKPSSISPHNEQKVSEEKKASQKLNKEDETSPLIGKKIRKLKELIGELKGLSMPPWNNARIDQIIWVFKKEEQKVVELAAQEAQDCKICEKLSLCGLDREMSDDRKKCYSESYFRIKSARRNYMEVHNRIYDLAIRVLNDLKQFTPKELYKCSLNINRMDLKTYLDIIAIFDDCLDNIEKRIQLQNAADIHLSPSEFVEKPCFVIVSKHLLLTFKELFSDLDLFPLTMNYSLYSKKRALIARCNLISKSLSSKFEQYLQCEKTIIRLFFSQGIPFQSLFSQFSPTKLDTFETEEQKLNLQQKHLNERTYILNNILNENLSKSDFCKSAVNFAEKTLDSCTPTYYASRLNVAFVMFLKLSILTYFDTQITDIMVSNPGDEQIFAYEVIKAIGEVSESCKILRRELESDFGISISSGNIRIFTIWNEFKKLEYLVGVVRELM